MLTGMPSSEMARSVPWSRLKPRRKYWLALPSPLCWRDDQARHRFQQLAGAVDRPRLQQIARGRNDTLAGGLRNTDVVGCRGSSDGRPL